MTPSLSQLSCAQSRKIDFKYKIAAVSWDPASSVNPISKL